MTPEDTYLTLVYFTSMLFYGGIFHFNLLTCLLVHRFYLKRAIRISFGWFYLKTILIGYLVFIWLGSTFFKYPGGEVFTAGEEIFQYFRLIFLQAFFATLIALLLTKKTFLAEPHE